MTPFDLHLFQEGTHQRLYEQLGARPAVRNGLSGASFAVWWPGASRVAVTGSFNRWTQQPMQHCSPGLWTTFLPGVKEGSLYKYVIETDQGSREVSDPVAFEREGGGASVVAAAGFEWHDAIWMSHPRRAANSLEAPIAISDSDPHRARELGFTHVLGPDLDGFAPATATPVELKSLVDHTHQHGLGVASRLHAPAGFTGREAQSAWLSTAVWWSEEYHLDLLIGRDLVCDKGWASALEEYLVLPADARSSMTGMLAARSDWAFESNFVLPVPPIGSAGWSEREQQSTERAVLAYCYALPGKKLVTPPASQSSCALLRQLNQIYRTRAAFHQTDHWHEGFGWLDRGSESGILAFYRRDREGSGHVAVIVNLTSSACENYSLGVPTQSPRREIVNTDDAHFGGRGICNPGLIRPISSPLHNFPYSITVTVPPLASVFLE